MEESTFAGGRFRLDRPRGSLPSANGKEIDADHLMAPRVNNSCNEMVSGAVRASILFGVEWVEFWDAPEEGA